MSRRIVAGAGLGMMAALVAAGMVVDREPIRIRQRAEPPAPRPDRELSKPLKDWTQRENKRAQRRRKGKGRTS